MDNACELGYQVFASMSLNIILLILEQVVHIATT